jgi:alpha-glucosidase
MEIRRGLKSAETRWTNAAIYQVYPYTFNEVRPEGAEYTGQGSIRGITEKRDYLHDLGINAIWISPFYPSPMVDGGYDISDYTGVDERLGTLDDLKELIEKYHERDMAVMIDLVPNHTSDQHPWFQESRASRDNPKSDWYIWRDPKPDGSPPNNWSSVFSFPNLRARENGTLIVPEGENTPPISAWQYDETRGQYYLRDFAAEQPNLNWQNPEVREAIKDVMRTWIERGVDGFRVDVANHLGKNPDFTDEIPNPAYHEGIDNPHDQHIFYNSLNYPPILYPYLEELTSVLIEYPEKDLRMILECWMPAEDLMKVDRLAPQIASSFNFTRLTAPWDATTHKELLDTYHANLPIDSIPNQVLSNHDVPRVATRLGRAAARSAAVLNMTLPGMTFTYNGEEGGFENVAVPMHRRRDEDLGERDNYRTPMLWNGSKNAGFSDADEAHLWLPIDSEYMTRNLEAQARDPFSFFSLYRTLLHMRQGLPMFQRGYYQSLLTDHPDTLAFARRHEHNQAITLVNFSAHEVASQIYSPQHIVGRKILSSMQPQESQYVTVDLPISLAAHEAVIIVPSA